MSPSPQPHDSIDTRTKWLPRFSLLVFALGLTATSAVIACWRFLSMPTPDERMFVDVEYDGAASRIQVDVFLPTITTGSVRRHPGVILLHGVEGADLQARAHFQTARRLNRQGYAVFFVHYFDCLLYDDLVLLDAAGELDVDAIGLACLSDAETWTNCVTDVVVSIAQRDDVDASHLALEGFSLGGFVSLATAARLQSESELPDVAAVVVNWGAKFETTIFSPSFPPVLFVHGEHDEVVRLDDARATVDAIQESGGVADLFVVPQGGHTASSVDSIAATENFLARYLQSQPELADSRMAYSIPSEIGRFHVHQSLWAIW